MGANLLSHALRKCTRNRCVFWLILNRKSLNTCKSKIQHLLKELIGWFPNVSSLLLQTFFKEILSAIYKTTYNFSIIQHQKTKVNWFLMYYLRPLFYTLYYNQKDCTDIYIYKLKKKKIRIENVITDPWKNISKHNTK